MGSSSKTPTSETIRDLAGELDIPEDELLEQAFWKGVRQLRRERVLGAYLQGSLSRDEAIERVGREWVVVAEQQRDAMNEDLEWALQ